jgi:epoxyqueuosine reductase
VELSSAVIKKLSAEAGFDACGISASSVDKSIIDYFNDWIKSGHNASMHYLNKYFEIRQNTGLLLENTKSVISVILNYYSNDELADKSISISKYAYGKDYHRVIKNKLYLLLNEIKKIDPKINGRIFVDTAPIFERYFAEKSGLGFIGKNNCLINETFGSWIFIGEILIDKELEYDSCINLNCGSCSKCIDFCPTRALSDKGLNANKCISYHTIENKDEISDDIKKHITTQIFGCDICQNVCPHNQNKMEHNNTEFKMLPQIKNLSLDYLKKISNAEFKKQFSETSLSRAGKNKLINNLEIIKIVKK